MYLEVKKFILLIYKTKILLDAINACWYNTLLRRTTLVTGYVLMLKYIFMIFSLGTTSKKKSKLRDIGPKGREGSEKNQFFSLIRKRENYLRGGGVKSKSPFLFGNFIGKFWIFFVRVLTTNWVKFLFF